MCVYLSPTFLSLFLLLSPFSSLPSQFPFLSALPLTILHHLYPSYHSLHPSFLFPPLSPSLFLSSPPPLPLFKNSFFNHPLHLPPLISFLPLSPSLNPSTLSPFLPPPPIPPLSTPPPSLHPLTLFLYLSHSLGPPLLYPPPSSFPFPFTPLSCPLLLYLHFMQRCIFVSLDLLGMTLSSLVVCFCRTPGGGLVNPLLSALPLLTVKGFWAFQSLPHFIVISFFLASSNFLRVLYFNFLNFLTYIFVVTYKR